MNQYLIILLLFIFQLWSVSCSRTNSPLNAVNQSPTPTATSVTSSPLTTFTPTLNFTPYTQTFTCTPNITQTPTIILTFTPSTTATPSYTADASLTPTYTVPVPSIGTSPIGVNQFAMAYSGSNILCDANENLYVEVQTCPSWCIFKYNNSGGALTSWNLGNYWEPIAIDSLGQIYTLNRSLSQITKYSSTGSVLAQWSCSADNIAIGPQDILYELYSVSQYKVELHSSINGTYQSSWPTYGPWDGYQDSMSHSGSICSDNWGDVYLVDGGIVKFFQTGQFLDSWPSGGTVNGETVSLTDMAYVDKNGIAYLLDNNNKRVLEFTTTGSYLNEFGDSGPNTIQGPIESLCVGPSGKVYLIDGATVKVFQ